MATVTDERTTGDPAEADQVVLLRAIGWSGYRRMLRLRGERPRPRMTYLDGDLLLMSPGHLHERDKERLGAFILLIGEECDIPIRIAGSTTYKRRKKESGTEPDQSYYLANIPRVLNNKKIDLRVDPPPDLSIEVVYSHSADAALEVSRRFGVPEVWVCTEKGLTFRVLGPGRKYAVSDVSPAFPFLKAEEIVDWIRRPEADLRGDVGWIKELRRWVREAVVPRVRGALP